MAHTPTPWKWMHKEFNSTLRKNSRSRFVYSLKGPAMTPVIHPDRHDYFTVMELPWYYIKGQTLTNVTPTPEDAEFIVRACNCHDELLKACKALLWALEGPDPLTNYRLQQAHYAIAKAEGRA